MKPYLAFRESSNFCRAFVLMTLVAFFLALHDQRQSDGDFIGQRCFFVSIHVFEMLPPLRLRKESRLDSEKGLLLDSLGAESDLSEGCV